MLPPNGGLSPFRVQLIEKDSSIPVLFDCESETASHAIEQAEDVYPNAAVIAVVCTRSEFTNIVPAADGDYHLQAGRDGAWITCDNANIRIRRADEGVIVDLYALGCEDGNAHAGTSAIATELALEALGDGPADLQNAIANLQPHQVRAHAAMLPEAEGLEVLTALDAATA